MPHSQRPEALPCPYVAVRAWYATVASLRIHDALGPGTRGRMARGGVDAGI